MRALVSAALLALSLGSVGCSGSSTPKPRAMAQDAGHSPDESGLPRWLPPYTPAQLALLEPPETPIQVPAERVFPDLSRFGYASDHRMEDAGESLKFTRMVAAIVTESRHFYVITEAPADVANTVAQYGPPGGAEPDAWQITRRSDQDGSGRLVPAALSAEAKADVERGDAAKSALNTAGAVQAYRDAIGKSPAAPALKLALAGALASSGDEAGAKAAYASALAIDPTLATAHIGLAEIHERRGEISRARRELAEALAYHPSSRRALTIANRLTSNSASAGRARPFSVFFDVDSVGAVRVAAPGGTPGQMYASCRAVMRYEPEVRAAIFEQPEDTPYYLSVVEEIVCLETAIGAYLFERHQTEGTPPNAMIERLLDIAQEEGLLGYAMFEILGKHRPERARTAPPDVHRAVVRYVERHVLGEDEALPPGIYSASR